MANHILDIEGHLGKTDSKAVGHEDWVVAKTVGAVALGEDNTVDTPFEIAWHTMLYQTDDSAEACLTIGAAVECGEQFVDVVVE